MFRMSKYHDRLLKHIEDNPNFVRPAKARKSLLTRLRKDKLQEIFQFRERIEMGYSDSRRSGACGVCLVRCVEQLSFWN